MADVSELTHRRVRCYGQHGIHRVDMWAKHFYTTGCGRRLTKDTSVLTAAAITCDHHGCKPAPEQAGGEGDDRG